MKTKIATVGVLLIIMGVLIYSYISYKQASPPPLTYRDDLAPEFLLALNIKGEPKLNNTVEAILTIEINPALDPSSFPYRFLDSEMVMKINLQEGIAFIDGNLELAGKPRDLINNKTSVLAKIKPTKLGEFSIKGEASGPKVGTYSDTVYIKVEENSGIVSDRPFEKQPREEVPREIFERE